MENNKTNIRVYDKQLTPRFLLDLYNFENRGSRLYEELINRGVIPFVFNSNESLDLYVNNDFRADIVLSFILNLDTSNVIHLNNVEALQLCKDKLECQRLLEEKGIKTIPTYTKYNKELGYPFVLKDRYGSLGNYCYLINNEEELKTILSEAPEKIEFMYQKFMSKSKGQHYRLMMLNGNCIGAMHVRNDSSFKSNAHQGGTAVNYNPSDSEIEMCRKICETLGVTYAGIDLLIDDDGNKIFCEANGGAFFHELEKATGKNIAGEIIDYLLMNYLKERGEFDNVQIN